VFSFTRRFHTFLKIHGAFWVGEGEMAQRLTNLSNKSVKLASEEFASIQEKKAIFGQIRMHFLRWA